MRAYEVGDFVAFRYIAESPQRFGYIQAPSENHYYFVMRAHKYAVKGGVSPGLEGYAFDCQVASWAINRAVWTVLGPVVIP